MRELGLPPILLPERAIYSGGVVQFLAGVERSMEVGAILGVHLWSDVSKEAMAYPQQAEEHGRTAAISRICSGMTPFTGLRPMPHQRIVFMN